MDNNKFQPTKPKQSKIVPIILLIIGLLVGLGSGYGISLLNKSTESKTENNIKTEQAPVPKKKLSDLTEAILNSKENSYINLRAFKSAHIFKGEQPLTSLLVDSISFEDEHRFEDEKFLMKAKQNFINMLEKQSLKFIKKQTDDADDITKFENNIYQNQDFTCDLTVFNSSGMRRLELACVDTEEYNKTIETFAKIYDDLKSAKDNQDIEKYEKSFYLKDLRDGKTNGYKIVEIGAPAASSTFYRTPDGKWHHSPIYGFNRPLKCSDFSEDAKKAFFKNGKCIEPKETLDKIKADIKDQFKKSMKKSLIKL